MGEISRRLLLAVPAVALMGLVGAPSLFALPASAESPGFAAIERACDGRLGIFAIDTGSGDTTGWRADDRFPFCSSFKALLAAFALWKADRREVNMNQTSPFQASDLVEPYYAPITRPRLNGPPMTIAALCAAAVEYSDNVAANALLRQVGGPAALTAWMRRLSDNAFQLTHAEPLLNRSHFGDADDTTTPRAMAQSFRHFAFGNVLSPASRQQWIAWLVACTTGGKRLRAGLPASWRVGDKTGTWNEGWFSTIDVALAWPPGRAPLVIAGFVTDQPSTEAGEAALAEVARRTAAWSLGRG